MAIDAGRAAEMMHMLWAFERDNLIEQCKNCLDARKRFEARRRQIATARRYRKPKP
jgi:hypothetical protein